MKTFIGYEGYYDIEDNGNIIQRMVDGLGKLTGIIKEYKDVNKIPNPFDRDAINNLMKMLNLYKFVGRC
ncbi:MAG: hypothetical protein HND39_16045 [Ignavibacteriota bacterium]|jgi:hypothetical protein|nr:hypothetical protein [Ignavibacteriales bacterium]MBL1123857.1 hypothetical protein [Ignavibacteriota bacterium]MBV6420939.1 hypothetical protein [Ignavibacteriaceae bacterium]MCE7855063.1 hypothetical protein [Ignavibacteria bacterium CHB3]MEB2295748.1 hypothetical protein [Ignavibacteria bacterium]